MAIIIRHLEGPLAGQEQCFDDSVEVVTFGRSPECQIVYPLECADVGRKHFALRRIAHGDCRIELFGKRYVAIDGVPAEDGMLVRSGSVIRLGRPDGPSFSVKFASEMADIAWSADEAGDDGDDVLSRYAFESDGALDLLVKRRSEPPTLTAGIPAKRLATHAQRAPEITLASIAPKKKSQDASDTGLIAKQSTRLPSRPKGVGSGAPPRSRDPREAEVVFSDIPTNWPRHDRVEKSAPLRRRVAPLWWIGVAVAAGMLAYLLLRREVALSAALGKLFHAAAPPPPAPEATGTDLVDVSVFGPTGIQAGGEGLIQVFLHHLSQREIAKALAKEADPDTARRGIQTLAAEITQGQRVEIIFEARGLGVDAEMQSLVWRGEPCACQFTVSAAAGAAGRTFHPRVLVLVDSVPVGSLTFALKVGKDETAATELRGDRARRYTYAFLSYASPDRGEVIKRAQGLKAGGTNFFNDLLSLEPGERWEKRLYSEIDRCDVFYLFWSSRAKASEWVMKETEYALRRRARSANGDPDIIPVIIEGPPAPTPPESLKDIHFNDSLLYVLAGEESRPPLGRA
jgi:hypothetical protein